MNTKGFILKGFILTLVAAFFMPLDMEAQLVKLKEKLEKKMNQAILNEIEIGEADTLQDSSIDGQEADEQFDLTKLGIGNVTVPYDETYNFKGMMQMKTEMFEKGKSESIMDADIWFNSDKGNVGMESRTVIDIDDEEQSIQATAIVDAVNMVMITFAGIEVGKTGMIIPVPETLDTEEGETDTDTESDVVVRKTGETKNICGYRCDEYVITEDKGKVVSHVWTTEDLKFQGSQKLFGSQEGMPRNFGQASIKGVVMAMETYEKDKLTLRSEVTKVDLNASYTISTADVSLMQMNMKK